MNRREFLASAAALAATSALARADEAAVPHQFPADVIKYDSYVETIPVAGYSWASSAAYEEFRDMKFGIRIHWGIYSIWHRGAESWPFLPMSFDDRQKYNDLYKTWNPAGFDADAWVDAFRESGMRMFTFTTKHHEGFSMFDTQTRVKNRANWNAAGGPKMEACDLPYSIMETPFKRDIVKELCDAAHKRNIKIDLYFSHSDWYDADFRPYNRHPLQVPSASRMMNYHDREKTAEMYGDHAVIVPDPSSAEVKRMMERHRAQLTELLTNYGKIDMLCLDTFLGADVWPELRKTVFKMRELQPDIMIRNRGIGNYGDYYTPERVVPGTSAVSDKPWFCIYPLGTDFSYEADATKYKGTQWIVHTLADTVAKGGGLEIGLGPSAHGEFHPEALRQMREAGAWLKVNGEAIYATRPREGTKWSQGDTIRYTRSKDGRFVYAILTEWPKGPVTLESVRPDARSKVSLLGTDATLPWTLDAARGTAINLPENLQQPENRPCEHAWTLKIETRQG